MKRWPLPREHGGYLTLVGATLAGLLVAPDPATALALGASLVAGYLAREPIEQLARRRVERLGLALLALWAVLDGLGAWWVAQHSPSLALVAQGFVLAMAGGSLVARRLRRHRTLPFEVLGMASLGASAGLVALAGGATPRVALLVALVLGTHAALSVPLVRSELRPSERARAGHARVYSLALLVGASLLVVLVRPWTALLALGPRALQLVLQKAEATTHPAPSIVGLRETLALAVATALVVLAVRIA